MDNRPSLAYSALSYTVSAIIQSVAALIVHLMRQTCITPGSRLCKHIKSVIVARPEQLSLSPSATQLAHCLSLYGECVLFGASHMAVAGRTRD